MKELYNLKDDYLVVQGCKKVNSSKNGRFRYETIGETQQEMELLEVMGFIYSFPLQTVQSHLQSEFNSSTQHRWKLCAVLSFS